MATGPEVKLTIKYDPTHPVELGRFTTSLNGIAEIYKVRGNDDFEEKRKDLRLYIKEIRKGSIEVDFVDLIKIAGGTLAPIASEVNTIATLFSKIDSLINWLLKSKMPHEPATKREVQAISDFVSPIAENAGSSVNLTVNDSPGAQIYIGSIEANAIQNNATKIIKELAEPKNKVYHEVPLVWHQTDRTGATEKRTKLKAIVEEISETPIPVYFAENEKENLTAEMINDTEYPYRKTFIVDIETISVQNVLKGYKILKLHSVLD